MQVGELAWRILSVLIGDEERQNLQGGRVARHKYAHRYYNPPEQIPQLGYKLCPSGFLEMASQLRPREVLIAYAKPVGTYYAAAHVTDEERMLELEKDWVFAPSYFAVDVQKLLGGFDEKLPESELCALLGLKD
jgi:hypothetical protein